MRSPPSRVAASSPPTTTCSNSSSTAAARWPRTWRTALNELGYEHVLTTLDTHDPLVKLEPDRRLGVLLASKDPVEPLLRPDVPWPERLLLARARVDGQDVEICNLHSPISSKPDQ